MTQNASDVEIANQGFAAFRQDLNDVLEDITTLHSGTAAPSTTYANQWWYETDTDKLYIRNEDNDAWIEILTLDQANDHLATLGASITLDGTGNVSIDSGDFTVDTDTLFVDASADAVGIGTTAPRTNLHVSGLTADDDPALGSSVAPFLVTNTANSYGLNIGVNNQGDAWLQAQSNTTSTAYDILLSPLGGNVHIATGGSQAGATVSGTSIRSLDILKSTNTTSGFNQIVFYNPNGAVGTIRTTGSSTAYNTSSDYRLKENVTGITDGIERVKLSSLTHHASTSSLMPTQLSMVFLHTKRQQSCQKRFLARKMPLMRTAIQSIKASTKPNLCRC
jgi:hypothetical protein